MNKVSLDKITFGNPRQLVLIGGPCVIESAQGAFKLARAIQKIAAELDLPYVFKASYDKANRSSSRSYRGPGMREGLKILARIKKDLGVPVLTDIHTPEQAEPAAEVADILQIPAFLCRQTDLLVAAAETGKIVNVKKGQFLSPWEVENIVHKLEECGTKKILLTDRGSSFGYNNLVNDFRGIPVMRSFNYPVVFDVTHSVQIPGGQGSSAGGAPQFIPTLSRCAVVAGADAIFMEVHENPSQALSDGANALALKKLKPILQQLVALKKVVAAGGMVP